MIKYLNSRLLVNQMLADHRSLTLRMESIDCEKPLGNEIREVIKLFTRIDCILFGSDREPFHIYGESY